MSLFFKGEQVEAVLFSPLEGHITLNGKPAAAANIKRWIAWKDKEGETDYFTTDENGYFSLPKKTALFHDNPLTQIVITQEITVEHENNSYLIWTLSRTTTQEYGELGGAPENVSCELTDKLTTLRSTGVLMGTMCKWESIKK